MQNIGNSSRNWAATFGVALTLFLSSGHANAASDATELQDAVNSGRAYQRAKEASLWSQPIMGVAMTLDAIRENGGDFNDIAYLSQPANWKWRILTPNSVSLYVTSIVKGAHKEPMVVELPPVTSNTDIFGTIMDSFQVPLTDVGSRGADKGNGGKYVIVQQGSVLEVPDGYIRVESERNISYLMFRIIPASFEEGDLSAAKELIEKIRIYPLNAPDTMGKHIDVYDKVFDTVDPRDASYFYHLTELLNQETVLEKDRMMMGMMRSIGYVHGQEFEVAADMHSTLSTAVGSALDELIIMTRDIAGAWWEGNADWMQPTKLVGPATQFTFLTDSEFATDARAETYSLYCCGPAKLGTATAYIYASRDTTGSPLDARNNYQLHVPANVPVEQFWSLTAYDAQTSVFFENVANVDISSLGPDLIYNRDGSIDLFVGPDAPVEKESNWIETNSENNAIFLFRFYGPTPAVRDGSWQMRGFKKME